MSLGQIRFRLDQTKLDLTRLFQIGLGAIKKLNQIKLDQIRLGQIRTDIIGLDKRRFGYIRLDQTKLGQAKLDRDWERLNCI